jgi:RNA polymerase sigma factor (sigma-70 family)
MKTEERFFYKEIVDKILSQNEQIIQYFFFEKCMPLFISINREIFNGNAEINELIIEFYLFLYEDNWRRLRSFDSHKGKLITWISKVARRFFEKKRKQMRKYEYLDIDTVKEKDEPLVNGDEPLEDEDEELVDEDEQQHHKLDSTKLIDLLPRERDRNVVQWLVIEGIEPQKVADNLGITVGNVYNIKRRALKKLMVIIENSKDVDISAITKYFKKI